MENNKNTVINDLGFKKGKVSLSGREYTLYKLFAHLSTFKIFSKESIVLKRDIKIDVLDIKNIFLANINRTTKYGLIWPCNLFLVLTCLISWVLVVIQSNGDLLNYDGIENIFVFTAFLGFFFFACFIILLVKICRKDKIYVTHVGQKLRQKNITHKEYLEMIDIFDGYLRKKFIYFKPISSERLIIRELNSADTMDYYQFGSKSENFTYMNTSVFNSVNDAKEMINKTIDEYQNNQIFKLAIELKDEKKVIGYIGLSKYDLSLYSCQIVYAIDAKYWGKGYVSEVVGVFVEYLKSIGKKLIIAGHVEENIASGKVLLKNGFVRDPKRDTTMIIHKEIKKIINYSIDERD